jgi:dethiobiotin synthetase
MISQLGLRKRLLITGTGPRVGKTTIGCALGFAMRARGMRVGVMKPVDTLESQDAQALALAVGSVMPMDLICPYPDSSTLAPDPARIARCFNEIAAQSDVVLVESANTIDFAGLASMLELEVIIVAGNRPGCVDAATLALNRCKNRGLKLAGAILCDCDPTPETNDAATQELFGDSWLGRMRHREPLAKAIVDQLI